MANLRRKTVQVDTGSVTGKDLTAVTSTTLSTTIASNVNRISVLINCGRATDSRISSATRSSSSYVLAKRSTANDGCFAEIWYLKNPVADTSNISVDFVGTCNANGLLGHVALYNVDLSDPVDITDETTGSGTSISASFTPNENNCVAVDGQMNTSNDSGSPASGQTSINVSSGDDSCGCSYETDIDATSETMGWTSMGSGNYSHAVVVFQGAISSAGALLLLNL